MAVFGPTPSASAKTATAVKVLFCQSRRKAKRKSRSKLVISRSFDAFCTPRAGRLRQALKVRRSGAGFVSSIETSIHRGDTEGAEMSAEKAESHKGRSLGSSDGSGFRVGQVWSRIFIAKVLNYRFGAPSANRQNTHATMVRRKRRVDPCGGRSDFDARGAAPRVRGREPHGY